MTCNPPYCINKSISSRGWRTEYNTKFNKKEYKKVEPILQKNNNRPYHTNKQDAAWISSNSIFYNNVKIVSPNRTKNIESKTPFTSYKY